MSTYKFYYFNVRARGEVSRLIFAAAGQQYEDIRYERDQWPSHKAEMPLGQMPVLEVDSVKLPQSLAIARFLAKQFQLAGKDNLEQAKVDAVVDTLRDLLMAFVPIRHELDETKKKELIKKFLFEEVPKQFQNLETLGKLYGNGGAFFVGNSLTWADLFFHEMAQKVLNLNEKGLDQYSWLQTNRAEIEKQPRIAEYLKNRPKTEL
jgi:glutathione S-transferase